MSSGKIPAYLKFGLPVVAKKYPSTSLALEVPKCGLCVDAHNEIPAALRDIVANYEDFSSAACAEYEHRYRFENYLQSIGDFIGLD
jgi:glycosyltransferase involved in cell wall biosynthesis